MTSEIIVALSTTPATAESTTGAKFAEIQMTLFQAATPPVQIGNLVNAATLDNANFSATFVGAAPSTQYYVVAQAIDADGANLGVASTSQTFITPAVGTGNGSETSISFPQPSTMTVTFSGF